MAILESAATDSSSERGHLVLLSLGPQDLPKRLRPRQLPRRQPQRPEGLWAQGFLVSVRPRHAVSARPPVRPARLAEQRNSDATRVGTTCRRTLATSLLPATHHSRLPPPARVCPASRDAFGRMPATLSVVNYSPCEATKRGSDLPRKRYANLGRRLGLGAMCGASSDGRLQ
jgi:hypothetical protein